jgi:mycothiol synthase
MKNKRVRVQQYSDRWFPEMTALAAGFPAQHLHGIDLPYRFSSWALDHPENAVLWKDEQDRLVGWAAMQTPFWMVDYACHPDYEEDLHAQIIQWADRRASQLLETEWGHPAWFYSVFSGQEKRIHDLETAGFVSQASVGENSWSKVWLKHARQTALDAKPPAQGFVIRPLAGAAEVDAYVDLHRCVFESRNMTTEWRLRTLQQPQYFSDLDLVAVDDAGRLAGFCICWLGKSSGRLCGQVEPMGVSPEYRRAGLGKVLLCEGLRRLYRHGAEAIYVETDNYRNAALALYESAGFGVEQDVLVFRKDYPVSPAQGG